MPVPFAETGKSPNYIAAIQTGAYMNVLGDVLAVIKLEELMMHHPAIQQQGGEYEECTQQDRFLAQIANQPLQGRGTHRCDLNMQGVIQL